MPAPSAEAPPAPSRAAVDPEAPPDTAAAAESYPDKSVLAALAPDGIRVAKTFSIHSRPFWAAVVLCALLALGLTFLDDRDDAVGEEMKTIAQINKFELNKLGQIQSRLASRTDSTLYEFLAMHHDTGMLQGSEINVVTEVIKAIEHDSAQTGLPLVMGLFSHVFKVWPQVVLPKEDRKKIEVQREKIGAYLSRLAASSTAPKSGTYDDAGNALIEETRLMLLAIRDSGAQLDNLQLGHILAETDLQRVLAFLKNVLLVDATRPFLERLSTINEREFGKDSTKDGKKAPSDKSLEICARALKELEDFLVDKPEASNLLRSMLLADLKKADAPSGRA